MAQHYAFGHTKELNVQIVSIGVGFLLYSFHLIESSNLFIDGKSSRMFTDKLDLIKLEKDDEMLMALVVHTFILLHIYLLSVQ